MFRRSAFASIPALTLVVALLAFPGFSSAVTKADADAARRRADVARRAQVGEQAQADRLLSEAKALEATISRISDDLRGIDSRLAAADDRKARLESEIAQLQTLLDAKQADIAATQASYDDRKEALGRRIEAVYRQGRLFYLQVLLEARSFSDLVARTSFVGRVMAADQSIMGDLAESRRSLENAKATLDRAVETLTVKRAEVAAQQGELEQLHDVRATRLAEQRGAEGSKQRLLAATKANISRLRAAVSAEEAEAARIERMLSGGGGSRGGGRANGPLTWPTPGYTTITSRFGWRIHPILGTRRFHAGIDVRAPYGARIVAVAAGTVVFAGDRGGYGNVVMIDHGDGLVSVYAHQSRIAVTDGAAVKKGQKIGEVGSTGLSTGPHLHFEIRVNGDPRDPLGYL